MKIQKLFYNPIGSATLLKKEIHRFMKVSAQTIIAPLLSNILYFGVFGGVLKTRSAGIEGINYLLFLAPGLAAMGAIFAAYQNPAFSIVIQKFQNTLQELNSYPISTLEKALAFVLGGTFRGVLVGSLTYLATVFFVGYELKYPLGFAVMLGIVSFIFASVGLLAGLYINSMEKLNFTVAILLTPLAYLGGVFFQVSRLPGVLAWLAYLNPVFPLVNLVRFTFLGVYEGNILLHLIMMGVFAIASFGFAVYTLERGIGVKTD